jgi:hypothetical protein
MNWNNMRVKRSPSRKRPSSVVPKSWLQIRDQVVDTFTRVLERNPEVTTRKTQFKVSPGALVTNVPSTMDIYFRDKKYQFSTIVANDQVYVSVHVADQTPFPASFFEYRCPVNHMGKIRKTALILMVKMTMAPFYEVHAC